ncbi:MAG TPA: acyltransferase [Mucilaginibacter sp.]|nr:acyltransferase [Mucilaginibacter sp.]
MKKLYLEFFRGAASVFILGWHIAFLAPTGHPTQLSGYWGTDALMIFFMLSGIVINLTESRKPKPAKEFLKNRFIRIYPLFIAGMLLAFFALFVTGRPFPSGKTSLGNFFMLSTMSDYMGYIVPSIQSNLAVWTLSFEMGFYILFAMTIGRNQKKAIFYWFLIALISIPLYFLKVEKDVFFHIIAILAFSSIWLVGYYIYEYRNFFYADRNAAFFCLGILPLISRMHFSDNFYDPFKYFILSLFAIPFLRYCLQLPYSGYKIKLIYLVIPHLLIVACALTMRYMPLKNALVYSTLPYAYLGIGYLIHISKAKRKIISLVNKGGTVLGKHSYSLYITHFPIVFMFSLLIHNIALYVLVTLPVVALTTYQLENHVQPIIMGLLDKRKASSSTDEGFKLDLGAHSTMPLRAKNS